MNTCQEAEGPPSSKYDPHSAVTHRDHDLLRRVRSKCAGKSTTHYAETGHKEGITQTLVRLISHLFKCKVWLEYYFLLIEGEYVIDPRLQFKHARAWTPTKSMAFMVRHRSFAVSRNFKPHRTLLPRIPSPQHVKRPYSTSSAHSTKPSSTSRERNVVFLTAILSTAGLSAFLYETYFAAKVHADEAGPSELNPGASPKSQRIREILHAQKRDTLHGVNVEHILTRCEESFLRTGPGVWRYDINQIASNCPIEDDHAEMVMRSPSSTPWHFWAVIDGHVSWETSASLAERLIPSVGGALRGLYSRNPSPSSESIDGAIKHAFVSLDNEFVYEAAERALKSGSRAQAGQLLSQAYAGAVAMLAFYDQAAGEVKVALTGDLRAVRGRLVNGKWETKVLTVEQDGDNPEEAERIRKEHPDEPDVVKNGRVLGFQPSRMFGDASLKWSVETQKLIHQKFLGLRPRDVVKTPPYITAEPVVTTADVKAGDFLILGCDGLWESLTSEEVVMLVGAWVKEATAKGKKSTEKKSQLTLPSPPESKEKTIRYQYWQIPKQFVNVDSNASTHLIRNALGGADTETMTALLSRTGSLSRRLRDDITVTVVFFGDSPL